MEVGQATEIHSESVVVIIFCFALDRCRSLRWEASPMALRICPAACSMSVWIIPRTDQTHPGHINGIINVAL
jgi:hypothetical protein